MFPKNRSQTEGLVRGRLARLTQQPKYEDNNKDGLG